MEDGRRSLGTRGELIAVRALQKAGLRIVERNWRCPAGELDIIAEERAPDFSRGAPDSRWLVVVEVRTRRGRAFGSALQAFPHGKQKKLRALAAMYVQEKKWPGPWRIDAVAVQMDRSGKLISVEHIRHAVTG
ncbi:MAG: YraN family protein [Caldilineaceae bacterium]|nr:YraN family protein [Caldilineaceae bacterium]